MPAVGRLWPSDDDDDDYDHLVGGEMDRGDDDDDDDDYDHLVGGEMDGGAAARGGETRRRLP